MDATYKIQDYQLAPQLEVLFGSKSALYTLLYLESYNSGYASKIAATFGMPITSIQQQLMKFETGGILVSYTVGRTRVFEFNPRSRAVKNLRKLLEEELKFISSENSNIPKSIYREIFCQRTRPRRSGKPLDVVPERLRR